MPDLRHFIRTVEDAVARHSLGAPGAYRRWTLPTRADLGPYATGINPYGCADAANILYTIQRFPADAQERAAWVKTMQEMQNPETGLFEEPTHHPLHTTAHLIAALELFEARPRYPLAALDFVRKTHELSAFLEMLDWRSNPWHEALRGAGVYAALVLAGEAKLDWEERYFTWLWDETDPQTGLLRKGRINPLPAGDAVSIFPHLAGTFHYLFNLQYARRPLRYPEKVVDTCLEFYERSRAGNDYQLIQRVGFAEMDWVYTLNRAVRQSGHRFAEAQAALLDFSGRYIPFLQSVDPETDPNFDDLHKLLGTLSCLAELQAALPGHIYTQRPLRLVLDRRPFI